jgi:hypothetical protein
MTWESNIVGVSDHSIVRHDPLNPNPNIVYREYDRQPGGGGGGAAGAAAAGGLLAHPLVLALAILGLVIFLVYLLFQRVVKPLVRWIFRIASPATKDPVPSGVIAARQRIEREKTEIERAIRANPNDPALLPRIQRLTGEVESLDRTVLQRLNQQAARAFGDEHA